MGIWLGMPCTACTTIRTWTLSRGPLLGMPGRRLRTRRRCIPCGHDFETLETEAPNWNAVSPWSPPTTAWMRTISDGSIDLFVKSRCKLHTSVVDFGVALGQHVNAPSCGTEAFAKVSTKMHL